MPARQKSEVMTPANEPQEVTQAGDRSLLQEDMEIKRTLEAQPKRRIRIAQVAGNSSDEKMPDVTVQINGYPYQIKRGVDVEVPESVAEVLQQSMDAQFVDNKGNIYQAREDLNVMVW